MLEIVMFLEDFIYSMTFLLHCEKVHFEKHYQVYGDLQNDDKNKMLLQK